MPSNWPPCFVGEGPLSGKALCWGRPFVGEGPLSGKALCWGRLFVGEGLLLAANFPTKGNIEVLQLVIVFKYSCIIRDLTAFRTTRLQVLICNMDSSYWWRHRLVAMPFPGKRSTRRNILKNYIMVCQLDKRCKSEIEVMWTEQWYEGGVSWKLCFEHGHWLLSYKTRNRETGVVK
jgi:hypothetical protein